MNERLHCKQKISTLPSNIKINYCGTVEYENVHDTLGKYLFFVLPTLGENFGHVILESLTVGVPTIISDRTMWESIEKANAGSTISLSDKDRWVSALQNCLDISREEWVRMSENSQNFVQDWLDKSPLLEANLNLFLHPDRVNKPESIKGIRHDETTCS